MRLLLVLVFGVLVSCSARNAAQMPSEDPLVYDAAAVARAETIAILIPGALAGRRIFKPAEQWADDPGYAIAFYRFPGMDGRALEGDLILAEAAAHIASFADRHAGKKIRLLGYSTGGPIALMAADQMAGDVKVAAMSTAVEKAGGLATTWRGTVDVTRAAARSGSVRLRNVWPSYYRTLLFGRKGLSDPEKMRRADAIYEQEKDSVVLPTDGLGDAHARDLQRWTLPEEYSFDPSRVRVFVGGEDPVFSSAQTRAFAARLGGVEVVTYPDQGHLLFLTQPSVFDDILSFFEAP